MRNFFLTEPVPADGEVRVSGELYRHMARALRLKPGDEVALTDPEGKQYAGVIREIHAKELTVRIDSLLGAEDDASVPRITLYQGLPKGEKLDLILQKSTELGVAEVVCFDADRSVVKLRGDKSAGKLERYQRIVSEAARQSGRRCVPKISLGGELGALLPHSGHSAKLLLWEGEQTARLKETLAALEPPETVAVVVGPEGGLTDREVEAAKRAGFLPVTLGRRILRTETAGLAILSILQFEWGDIG